MSPPLDEIKKVIDLINDDGGPASRKFRVAIVSQLLIILCGVVAGVFPGFSDQYSSAVWGIVSIALGYIGGNVAARYVTGKTVGDLSTPTIIVPPTPPAPPPEPAPPSPTGAPR